MNIQRYFLPVTIAAAFHAALVWGFPKTPGHIITKAEEVPTGSPPVTVADDPVIPPPEEEGETVDPVKQLAGGPTPPVSDELPSLDKPDGIPIPMEPQPRGRFTDRDLKIVPAEMGTGMLGPRGPGGGTTPGFFTTDQLDRKPQAKVQPSPDYPARLRLDGVSGSVVIEFDVNTAGQVTRAEAKQYTHREFVEPALRAVRNWRFEPGRRENRAVPFRMVVPISFNLEGQ